jgi:hypothetical protein
MGLIVFRRSSVKFRNPPIFWFTDDPPETDKVHMDGTLSLSVHGDGTIVADTWVIGTFAHRLSRHISKLFFTDELPKTIRAYSGAGESHGAPSQACPYRFSELRCNFQNRPGVTPKRVSGTPPMCHDMHISMQWVPLCAQNVFR